MSNKLEKQVRDPCINMAKNAGVLHKRMHFGHGAATGWPDDLFVFNDGSHWWVEFKAAEGEASPFQAHMHRQMRSMQCDVMVINDKDDFANELSIRIQRAYQRVHTSGPIS